MEEEVKTKKECFYEKWWFWVIITLFIIGILIFLNDNGNNATNNIVENKTNATEEIIQENPYKETDKYNGIYKFILNSDNGSGYIFTSKGALEIKNGECTIKYLTNSDTISEHSSEYDGFCGIDERDNSNFYFKIIKKKSTDSIHEDVIYKCSQNESKNLSCEKMSEFDLSGCTTNSKLDLLFVNDARDIDEVVSQVVEEEKIRKQEEEKIKKEQEENTYKESCQTYTYEQMARNPENFKGTNVKVTGKVVQVMADKYSTNLRVNITKAGRYTTYYTDTIYVVYHPKDGEDKILEDDIVTIYGTSQGDCSYTTVMGSTVTLPNIKAEYIEINK